MFVVLCRVLLLAMRYLDVELLFVDMRHASVTAVIRIYFVVNMLNDLEN